MVAAFRLLILLVRHFDGSILPLLWDSAPLPVIYDVVVEPT